MFCLARTQAAAIFAEESVVTLGVILDERDVTDAGSLHSLARAGQQLPRPARLLPGTDHWPSQALSLPAGARASSAQFIRVSHSCNLLLIYFPRESCRLYQARQDVLGGVRRHTVQAKPLVGQGGHRP